MPSLIFNNIRQDKPLILLPNYNITTLVDTGSFIAIWFGDLKSLRLKFPGSIEKINKYINVNGVTGSSKYEVVKINNFNLNDGRNNFKFKSVYVAIANYNRKQFKLLLPYNMFYNMDVIFRIRSLNSQIAFNSDATNFDMKYFESVSDSSIITNTESFICNDSEFENVINYMKSFINNLI